MNPETSNQMDKYEHLFKDEPDTIGKQSGWFRFDRMYASEMLTNLHAVAQLLIIGAVVVFALMAVFMDVGAVRFVMVIPAVIAGLILMFVTRIAFELIIIMFRIYEELRLTRLGIDDFNSKVRSAQSPK